MTEVDMSKCVNMNLPHIINTYPAVAYNPNYVKVEREDKHISVIVLKPLVEAMFHGANVADSLTNWKGEGTVIDTYMDKDVKVHKSIFGDIAELKKKPLRYQLQTELRSVTVEMKTVNFFFMNGETEDYLTLNLNGITDSSTWYDVLNKIYKEHVIPLQKRVYEGITDFSKI